MLCWYARQEGQTAQKDRLVLNLLESRAVLLYGNDPSERMLGCLPHRPDARLPPEAERLFMEMPLDLFLVEQYFIKYDKTLSNRHGRAVG